MYIHIYIDDRTGAAGGGTASSQLVPKVLILPSHYELLSLLQDNN